MVILLQPLIVSELEELIIRLLFAHRVSAAALSPGFRIGEACVGRGNLGTYRYDHLPRRLSMGVSTPRLSRKGQTPLQVCGM